MDSKSPGEITHVRSITLTLDAMCYQAAQRNYIAARQCVPTIKKAETEFDRLVEKETKILEAHSGQLDECYDELETLAIMLEGREYDVSSAYAPFLEHLATVHILCVTALEAHINTQAKELLEQSLFGALERISLKAKWLLLPRLLGLPGFSRGAEPFQSLTRLVRYRNRLVHYKGEREEWDRDTAVPGFLEKLGLTLPAGEGSLNSVKGMVGAFARQRDQELPYWLVSEDGHYFRSEFRFLRESP